MHQKRRLLQDLFVVSWIEQKKYCSHWMFDDGFVLDWCFESGFWRASSNFAKVVIGALYFFKCKVIIITFSWHFMTFARNCMNVGHNPPRWGQPNYSTYMHNKTTYIQLQILFTLIAISWTFLSSSPTERICFLSKTSGDAPEQPWTGHHFL